MMNYIDGLCLYGGSEMGKVRDTDTARFQLNYIANGCNRQSEFLNDNLYCKNIIDTTSHGRKAKQHQYRQPMCLLWEDEYCDFFR